MQLPRKVIIGNNILNISGKFIKENSQGCERIILITGKNVKTKVSKVIEDTFTENNIQYGWIISKEASFEEADNITESLKSEKISLIVGIGGGRCIDIGKIVANRIGIPFVSMPTSAAHDGISSPFVSLKGNERPYSIKADTPVEIIGDLHVISQAPTRLIISGCGDLIAKITAIKDWELARDYNNEYFGEYAANLAYLGAKMVIDISNNISNKNITIQITRTIVEGLISSGVAAGIAGSSRPCSGSEHLFSHALEYITNGKSGLHGERVGMGTIIMAKLHNLGWKEIRNALVRLGAPTTGREIQTDKDQLIDAILLAKHIRPERYTILNKLNLSKSEIQRLLEDVSII